MRMTIQDAIRKLAGMGMELYCKICTVDSVDEAARTVDCTPIDEGAPLLGVNLQANQDGEDGVVSFPAAGSYVIVAFLSPATAVVVLCDKVDKIKIKIGATTAEIVDGEIKINEGKLGGLMVSQKTADKLNALENDVNDLKTALAGWAPVPQDGGAALKGAISPWAGQLLHTTAAVELENSKIKH